MITDSFDNISKAIISPDSFYGEKKHICELAIPTFSREIYSAVLEKFPNEQNGEINHSLDKFYVALEIAKRL